MNSFLFWIARWLSLVSLTLSSPFLILFSRAGRRKIQEVYVATTSPYWDRVISLSALIDDPVSVQVLPLKSLDHNCTEFELLALGALAKQTRCRNIFEIGTYDGRSTRTLAANSSENGLVTTLNLPPGKGENDSGVLNVDALLNLKVQSGYRFLATLEETKIRQIYGDSATYDFESYRGAYDLVFIDGSHSEAYVEKDTHTALLLLRSSGGLIVWHDATRYGVVTYLHRNIRKKNWPLKWVQDSSLMIGYARDGKFVSVPLPLPRLTPNV